MANNKVQLSDGTVLLDLTGDTVTPETLMAGVTAHNAAGEPIVGTGDGSNLTVAFTTASTRVNIATGEKLSVLFGKIAKWFSDLGSLAFKSTVAKSDLSNDVQTSLDKANSALQIAPVTSVNGKTGAVTVNVPTVPSTTAILKGNGLGGVVAAVAGSDYATPPIARKVMLTTAGWNANIKQQTATVSGVLADATKQAIHVTPVDLSYESAWNKCGVLCVAQAANSLTFQCAEVPTNAIEVYVTIEPVNYA